jgi:phosphoenolpyruvate-protein kinase (PTS system EI component)
MGIPAAMSVRDCLSRLSNGCRVRVDGSRGRIVLLEDAKTAVPARTREPVAAG